MIIESKFKDYYDPIAKTYRDKSIVFKRHNQEIKDNLPKDLPRAAKTGYKSPEVYYIVFCGKLYPYVLFPGNNGMIKGLNRWGYEDDKFSYDLQDVKRNVGHNFKSWDHKIQNELNNALSFNWTDFCIKHNTPTILINPSANNYNIELNPRLKDCQFYKVFNIQETYQQIYQFLGMVLTKPDKPAQPISDELKAKNHGMDKWSFRNPDPPKRKIK